MTSSAIARMTVLYVHLLLLEGALRKWVPGFDQLGYLIRDGLMVLVLTLVALGTARRRPTMLFWVYFIAVALMSVAHIFAGASTRVTMIGAQSYIAPTLILYAVVRYAGGTREARLDHARRIARALLIWAPVEAALTVLQVLSPASAFINREVSSDVATLVNFGVVRASGTFSAPAGLTLFVPLALAAAIWLVFEGGRSKALPALSVISCVLIAALSGSRTTFVACGVVVLAAVVALVAQKGTSIKIGSLAVVLIVTVAATGFLLPKFSGVLDSFDRRVQQASHDEDVAGRVRYQTIGYLDARPSLIGVGPGQHSQAGISQGARGPWIEVDSIRWVVELGLLGWVLAIGRTLLVLWLVAWVLVKRKHILAVLITGALVPVLAYGQVNAFPTAQGAIGIAFALLYLAVSNPVETTRTSADVRRHATAINA